jgi:hypothetical protein
LGQEDGSPSKGDQYARWHKLRELHEKDLSYQPLTNRKLLTNWEPYIARGLAPHWP